MALALQASPVRAQALVRHIAAAIVPCLLWVFFVSAHVRYFLRTGSFIGFVVVAQESLVLYWFVVRRPTRAVSHRPQDWLSAGVGTFAVALLRPSGSPLLGTGELWLSIQLLGAVLACASSLSLGRSFGLVAANRGVKSTGVYSVVRHPLYAAYCVTWIGYFGASPTGWNAFVLAVALTGQLLRIAGEERVLLRDPAYAQYAARVRWRLMPGIA